MKKLFRLVVILASLLLIIGCGQNTVDSDASTVTKAATYSTSAKTKALFETVGDTEKRTEHEEDEAEDDETETETASIADDSTSENNETNSNEVAATETQSDETSTNQSTDINNSGAKGSSKQSGGSQSSGQQSKNNEQKSSSSSKNTTDSKGNNSKSTTNTSTATVSVESPSDLNGPNVGPITVEISAGDTAYSATKKAMDSVGIEIRKTGSGATLYVQAIGGLGEFDAGPLSGWNVFVDGAMIPRSSDAWEISDGATIHWRYTKNYLED